ncbi:MAG TPA: PAS domain S-box protein, partial [Aquabacterium sp.]|nr:PAS domain S-box protein [Aquabacterium sp.]
MTRSAPWPRSPDPVPGLPAASGSAPARMASPLLQSLTQLASTLCDAPVALLSLIEPQHHAVCASVGLALGGSTVLPHLTWSVQTLHHPGLLQVPDTQADPHFASDLLACGEHPLRFYAGVALRQDNGPPFGTLCVMDHRPRTLTPEVARQLEALADSCAQALGLTRRAQDAALAETEGRYRAIVESQSELISLSTPDGTLTFVNTAYARHFDRPAAELLGTHLLDLVPPNDQEAVASHLASVCSHRLVLSNETRYVDADGQVSWISWTNSPVLDRQGQVTAIQSVGRDVTERKLTERSLKESQARLRSLYESTPAMLHSIDAQGRLLSVSDTWLAKMGYTRREVIGRNSAEFLTAASLDYARKVVLPRYLQTGRCDNIEYQMVRKDGSLIDVLLSATMERDEHGQPLRSLAVLEDITEKHAVEAALRSNQERLTLATQANGIGIWEYNLAEQRLAWSDIMFQIFGRSRETFHGRLDD